MHRIVPATPLSSVPGLLCSRVCIQVGALHHELPARPHGGATGVPHCRCRQHRFTAGGPGIRRTSSCVRGPQDRQNIGPVRGITTLNSRAKRCDKPRHAIDHSSCSGRWERRRRPLLSQREQTPGAVPASRLRPASKAGPWLPSVDEAPLRRIQLRD